MGRLREAFPEVVGVDPDPEMARLATARYTDDPAITIRKLRLAEVEGEFDVVTMVASLHHMPTEQALAQARELLRPGGRLLVVGLARVERLADEAYDIPSALLNPLVGLVKHPRVTRSGPDGPAMPVRDPAETFAELTSSARRILPGVKARRQLFFRYTLEWQCPSGVGLSSADRVALTGE